MSIILLSKMVHPSTPFLCERIKSGMCMHISFSYHSMSVTRPAEIMIGMIGEFFGLLSI